MSELVLTGLAGSHPLGALAAFGLLRCCEEIPALSSARLFWKKQSDWLPILQFEEKVTEDDLIRNLIERQKERCGRRELVWADNIRTKPEVFTAAVREASMDATYDHRGFADFLAAFGCELVTNQKGETEATAFYMTSGQQKFLKELKGLAGRLASGVTINRRTKNPEELFREALFGPWRYEDPQHSRGWDPTTERLHALRPRSPTKEPSQGVSAAVGLAFEALPLFPCFLSDGRLKTRGFHRSERRVFFTWPLWTEPASLPTVRSLLGLEGLTRTPIPTDELRARGITAVYRSERYKVKTQGAYFILRPSSPC